MLKALEQPDHRNRKQKGEDVNFEHIIKSNQIKFIMVMVMVMV